ncbi:hypothetical protein A0H81_11855 [Grifola frondosa]|uniref:Uncharacterized protein n=1 Tax=Grifola frondosa TaxID=5627 RepID=A0A1C7LV28_GRIFR|nr:hypothetical protein A0H81_11855 [Grifola frondosa]
MAKEYWHKVVQHYLSADAKKRFDEPKMVMKNMHGGKHLEEFQGHDAKYGLCVFFVCATLSALLIIILLAGEIGGQKTKAIKAESKPSGLCWIVGRGGDSDGSKNTGPNPSVPLRPQPNCDKASKGQGEIVDKILRNANQPTEGEKPTWSTTYSIHISVSIWKICPLLQLQSAAATDTASPG